MIRRNGISIRTRGRAVISHELLFLPWWCAVTESIAEKLPRKRFVKLSSRRGPLNTPTHSPFPTFRHRFHLLTSSFNSRAILDFSLLPSILPPPPLFSTIEEKGGRRRRSFENPVLLPLSSRPPARRLITFSSRVSDEMLVVCFEKRPIYVDLSRRFGWKYLIGQN